VLCFNVLTHNPHYGKPLETLLRRARRRLLLRESFGETLTVNYAADAYIDPEKRHLRTYFNTYPHSDVRELISSAGFDVTPIVDRRTGDGTEAVCGFPIRWRILLAERRR
jgi:hypothetical protein